MSTPRKPRKPRDPTDDEMRKMIAEQIEADADDDDDPNAPTPAYVVQILGFDPMTDPEFQAMAKESRAKKRKRK